jgi:hypothetical protein
MLVSDRVQPVLYGIERAVRRGLGRSRRNFDRLLVPIVCALVVKGDDGGYRKHPELSLT